MDELATMEHEEDRDKSKFGEAVDEEGGIVLPLKMVLCLPFSTSDQHYSLGWNHFLIGPWLASQDGARKHNTQSSRKERSSLPKNSRPFQRR